MRHHLLTSLLLLGAHGLFADEASLQPHLEEQIKELEQNLQKTQGEQLAALSTELHNQIAALEKQLTRELPEDLKSLQNNFTLQIETLKTALQNEQKALPQLLAEVQEIQGQVSQMQSARSEKPAIFNYREPLDFHGVTVFAEYLYWGVSQQASTYLLTPISQLGTDTTVSTYGVGKYRSASFDWNSGFRVGLGYTFAYDGWDLLGQYTRFTTSGEDHTKASSNLSKYLFATMAEDSAGHAVLSASDHIGLSYQVGDLLLGKQILAGQTLLFNFNLGLSGAWIDETWRVSYNNDDATTTHIRNRWSFNGGGVRAGLDTNWHMGKGFGIFSKLGAAAYVGSYHNHRTVDVDPSQTGWTDPVGHTIFKEVRLQPMGQIALGFDWGKVFRSWAIRFMVGGEANTWFNLHQYFQNVAASNEGDSTTLANDQIADLQPSNLSLYGLTMRLSIDF